MLFGYFTDGQRGSKASDPNRVPSRRVCGGQWPSLGAEAASAGEWRSRAPGPAGSGSAPLMLTASVPRSSSVSCQGAMKQEKRLLELLMPY